MTNSLKEKIEEREQLLTQAKQKLEQLTRKQLKRFLNKTNQKPDGGPK